MQCILVGHHKVQTPVFCYTKNSIIKIGFCEAVKQFLVVDDPIQHRDHPDNDVVLQKIYEHVAGYHTVDHPDDLCCEPLLTAMLGKERSASQPTISWFNEKAMIATSKSLEKVNEVLHGRVYVIEPRDQFVMDLDSSGFAAHGEQQGANYNHHYQQKGFHTLFCFDGLTGDCLRAELPQVTYIPLVKSFASWGLFWPPSKHGHRTP